MRPLVLAYHAVEDRVDPDADPERLVTAAPHLESHVRLLRRLRYRLAAAGDLLVRPGSGRTAVLTFDDGWRSSLTVAAPLLERLGLRATFFLCPGLFGTRIAVVGGDAGLLLSADEARELHEAGMELGSHTLSHPDLRLLGDDEVRAELTESKEAIEDLTGERCRLFAYPHGLHDARVEAAVARAGYELAFAWAPGPWRATAAPRLPAPPRHGAGRLALKLLGVRRRP
jgi:peptidoglycan/xylan/chitin deacetylase (PgdA/CDA1 family)